MEHRCPYCQNDTSCHAFGCPQRVHINMKPYLGAFLALSFATLVVALAMYSKVRYGR